MTRMWGVDPKMMCDQHLLGEHNEMHQAVGVLEKHPYGRKIIEGHCEKQQLDTSLIQERHDVLAQEMEQRGFNHDSPLDYTDQLGLGSIEVQENRRELAERCRECRNRIRRQEQ